MKSITIDFYGKEADYILLESIEDVREYDETILSRDTTTAAQRLLKTDLPPERLDHLATNDPAGAVLSGAHICASFRGTSMLGEIVSMAHDKLNRFAQYIADGEKIMVNENGGFCFLTPTTKVLREGSYESSVRQTHMIKYETTYINLENDADLEQYTIDYMAGVDPNFSYVTNLRDYDHNDLVKVFTEFKEAGGLMAYVYTTGGDIKQIHEYCDALLEADIDTILFHFNSGISEELALALVDIIDKGMTVISKEV